MPMHALLIALIAAAEFQTPAQPPRFRAFTERTEWDIGSTYEGLLSSPGLVFERLDRPLAPPGPDDTTRRLGPYDERRHGFRWLTVRVGRTFSQPEDRESRDSSAGLELTLVAERADSSNVAWRLRRVETPQDDLDTTIANQPSEQEDAGPATPDPTLPLVVVRFAAQGHGFNTVWSAANELLVDATSVPPRAMAWLSRAQNDGGGVCGVWGNRNQNSIACRWEPRPQQFMCTWTSLFPEATWGHKTARRRWILGREAAEPAHCNVTDAPTTRYFPGAGMASRISRLGNGKELWATGGSSAGLDARFFATDPRGAVARNELAVRGLDADPSPEKGSQSTERCDAPDFQAARWHVEPGLEIWQVLAKEQGHGTHYLLGFDANTSDVLRISTDAGVQGHCGGVGLPSMLLKASRPRAPFDVDVEWQGPFSEGHVGAEEAEARFGDDLEGSDGRACTESGRLRWIRGKGFELTHGPLPTCLHPELPVYPEISFEALEQRRVRARGPGWADRP